MVCRTNNECLTGNVCRKNRGFNFGICVSGNIIKCLLLGCHLILKIDEIFQSLL